MHRLADSIVRDSDSGTATFANSLQYEKIANRLWYAQSARDGVCLGPRFSLRFTFFPCLDNRGTACCLHGDEPRAFLANPTECLQFRESFPHPDDAGAAAGRIDDDIGQLPSELFGKFKPHRLFTLHAIWFLEGGHVKPSFIGFSFRHNFACVRN